MGRHNTEEAIEHHRFRTPRTTAKLGEMYNDAIDIPRRLPRKGPDATAPTISQPTPVSDQGRSRKRSRASTSTGASSGARESVWIHHAHLITEIGHRVFSMKESEDPGAIENVYDVAKLTQMFHVFADACKKFATELDFLPDGFIACAVYALCEPTTVSKRHNVYKRVAFEAFYEVCTELPNYVYAAVRQTWSLPGEVFSGFLPTHIRDQRRRDSDSGV